MAGWQSIAELVRERTRFSVAEPTWVRPSYDGLGIVNLPWSVLATLGIEPAGLPLDSLVWPASLAAGCRAVLLVIVDGLGYERLARAIADGETAGLARLVADGAFFPLTSVFPATTVAALTALATGEPPARHGLLGFTVFLREFGMLSNLLFWSPLGRFPSYASLGLEPRSFLPVTTIAEHARTAGIGATVISPEAFRDTPLTKMHTSGATFRGYRTAGEFVAQTWDALAEPGPQLVVAYWDTLDTLGHFAGPESPAWRAELRHLDRLLVEELLARLPRRDVLVIITADHGMVSLDPERQVSLHDPELLGQLALPPAGERRAMYLHPLPGHRAAVGQLLADRAGSAGWVADGKALLADGIFGPPPHHPEAPYRIGELVLCARGGAGFVWEPPGSTSRRFLGAHASLEASEQLVPCIVWHP